MPLIIDPEQYAAPILEALIAEHRDSLAEMLEEIEHPKGTVQDPGSFRTARELVSGVLALVDALRSRTLTKQELARLINVEHEALLAATDLVKSHSDVPKVPRRGRPVPDGERDPT